MMSMKLLSIDELHIFKRQKIFNKNDWFTPENCSLIFVEDVRLNY